MHRSLVPFLFLVLALALGVGGIAQAGDHEEQNPGAAKKEAAQANPCAAKEAAKANPCAAKKELPPVDSAADAAEKARERAAE